MGDNAFVRVTIAKRERGNAGALGGVLGDEHAGPAVHVIHGAAGERIVTPARWSTAIVTLVVKGSATIDGKHYGAGEIRIHREDTPMAANIAAENEIAGAECWERDCQSGEIAVVAEVRNKNEMRESTVYG